MDKKSIRINFNFNIAKNKNGRNNSHFKTKHYDFNRTLNE